MAFSSRNIIRCLLKKRLTKGGGGHACTVPNIIVMAFSSRNIIRCLLKKRLTKGGGGVTRALCQTLSSWRFRHGILYVVCLKKGLQRGGGSRAPQDPPRYALASSLSVFFYLIPTLTGALIYFKRLLCLHLLLYNRLELKI